MMLLNMFGKMYNKLVRPKDKQGSEEESKSEQIVPTAKGKHQTEADGESDVKENAPKQKEVRNESNYGSSDNTTDSDDSEDNTIPDDWIFPSFFVFVIWGPFA